MSYNKGRATKIIHRGLWSLLSTMKHKPPIEVIHRRDIPGEKRFHEFVYRCKEPAYIEPLWGYIITKQGNFLEDSLATPDSLGPVIWFSGLPSPIDFYKNKPHNSLTIVNYPLVVSLRFPWEWNYYHFYLDVLGKLSLLDSLGIDRSTPLVLGKYAYELPFVQQIIQLGDFKNRNWLIQEENYILADEIIYCRSRQDCIQRSKFLLEQMQIPDSPLDATGKVFLTRSQTATRHILNIEEVEKVFQNNGFQIIDTGSMSIIEQINLLSKTRYLVGINGAGLVNSIFRKNAPLSLLELHSKSYYDDAFKSLVVGNGDYWDDLAGEPDNNPSPQNASFTLSPELLEQKIQHLLST